MFRKLLCELTKGGAGADSADKLFAICKTLAQVFLSSQYWSLRSVPGHSRQIEDLACDFVADIFERDESGYFPQIARFFSDLAIEVVPEEVLLSELRRLVFNKVRDNLYRYQKAHDPGLHRIIRGLKIACTEADDLHHKNGSIVLENDATRGKPEISFELLEIKLCRILKRHQSIRNVLQELMQMLVDQQEHSPRIELIQLAMAIRNVEFYLETEVTDAAQDDILPGPNELESFAVMAGQKVMDKLGLVSPLGKFMFKTGANGSDWWRTEYGETDCHHSNGLSQQNGVSAYGNGSSERTHQNSGHQKGDEVSPSPYVSLEGKLPDTLLIHAAVLVVLDEYCSAFSKQRTQFELVSELVPGLDYTKWRSNYRKRFEYLLKLTRGKFIEILRRELNTTCDASQRFE
jgi:hypothetical protein